jgi:hypothetical protein
LCLWIGRAAFELLQVGGLKLSPAVVVRRLAFLVGRRRKVFSGLNYFPNSQNKALTANRRVPFKGKKTGNVIGLKSWLGGAFLGC